MENSPAQPESSASPELITCLRCRHASPAGAGRCLYCNAPLPGAVPRPRVVRVSHVADHTHRGVSWLFWTFGLMLLVNVGLSWFLREQPDTKPIPEEVVRTAAVALSVAELVDSVLVVCATLFCARLIPIPPTIGRRTLYGWATGFPVLLALLGVNIAYHWFLLSMAGVEPEGDALLQSGHHRWWLVALMCIQPAVIEELFFRRLVFDFFVSHTTVGTAAFASAAMFAAAHTGGLLSFPYLALFGFAMAWLRWWTGSLALPMTLHFLHNLLISLHELGAP